MPNLEINMWKKKNHKKVKPPNQSTSQDLIPEYHVPYEEAKKELSKIEGSYHLRLLFYI